MHCCNKALVYPYGAEFAPILRNKQLLRDYKIESLVSPAGWRLALKDAGRADFGPDTSFVVSGNFDDALATCDTVIFADYIGKLDFDESVFPKMLKAAQNNKNIVNLIPADMDKLAEIKSICENNGMLFKNYTGNKSNVNQVRDYSILNEFETPIIFVLGVGEKAGKFQTQLCLRQNLMSQGYKVSQIGSRKYCELLGFHSFPEVMFDCNISAERKIFMFNSFVKLIEKKEKPDVIIIGIPGGIAEYNKNNTFGFGLPAFQAAHAVTPDAAILCTYTNEYTEEYFKDLCDAAKHKLNLSLNCFCFTNTNVGMSNIISEKQLEYKMFDWKITDKIARSYKHIKPSVFHIPDEGGGRALASFIVNQLHENFTVYNY